MWRHHHQRRSMAHVDVVPVSGELLRGEFPVTVKDPLMHSAHHNGAFGIVIQHRIHVPGHVAQRLP
ncbi:Uncharacterised protein [Mycobacteroides abscessus subsp. abscessus]|nr:Uncharacterised protein [Mycobacteroides abscessus subsp. abscessus]